MRPRQFFRGFAPGFARVEVVRSRDGLQLSLAVTLVMATVVAFLRPYAHAQALSGLTPERVTLCGCGVGNFLTRQNYSNSIKQLSCGSKLQVNNLQCCCFISALAERNIRKIFLIGPGHLWGQAMVGCQMFACTFLFLAKLESMNLHFHFDKYDSFFAV